jgi:hypothetical protein
MNNEAGVIMGLAALTLSVLLGPAIMLWSANTFSEQAQWGWQIPHNMLTYLACWGLILLFRTSK